MRNRQSFANAPDENAMQFRTAHVKREPYTIDTNVILQTTYRKDELLVRIDDDADAFGVRTLMDEKTSFREAVRIVRDAWWRCRM
jgi:hypothetical protein